MSTVTTIKQLPNTDTLSDTDLFLVSSGGTTKNISWGQVKAMIEGKREPVTELRATNTLWNSLNVTNLYTTNLYTTWITNDFSHPSSQNQKGTEVIASVVPKPIFTTGQWWMISFGVIISLVCIIRILTSLKLDKPPETTRL